MRRVKRRIWSGNVLEQEIYIASDGGAAIRAKKRLRFRDEAERAAHREKQQLREFTRWMNSNFCERDLYVTLTFDDAHEVHEWDEARRIRANYARRLKRAYPDAVFCIFMGRGRSTSRIHFHAVIGGLGVSAADGERILMGMWGMGAVCRVEQLRARNILYNGVAVGRDYSGLAAYLWRHWTPEQGGHHCYKTRNGRACEREDAAECHTSYSLARLPKVPQAPEGYEWVLADHEQTRYGYQYFKWVLSPVPRAPGRPRKTT